MLESVLREAGEEVADLADLQHDEVPGGEHVVEIVRVDPEQDRGHSNAAWGSKIHCTVGGHPLCMAPNQGSL